MIDTIDLRKCATAIYLVLEEVPARDVAAHLNWAADEIDRLRHALREIAWHDPQSPAAAMVRAVLGPVQ
jgi:hypothetical protein